MTENSLYRKEAIAAQTTQHLGVPTFDTPPNIYLVCICLLTVMTTAMIWVGSSHYARKLQVTGTIDNDHAKQIVTTEFGQLTELVVTEGSRVTKGQYLGRVAKQRFIELGNADEAIRQEKMTQQEHWRNLKRLADERLASEQNKLKAQYLSNESLAKINARDIALQAAKIEQLEQQLSLTEKLRIDGYISNLDWINFRTAVISEKQSLNGHKLQSAEHHYQMSSATGHMRTLKIEHDARVAEIELQLSQLAEQSLQHSREAAQYIKSPIDGLVTRLDARVGDTLAPGSTILYIGDPAPRFSATANIPSHAAGFVTVGQLLKLEVDAFPVGRHGRLAATIEHISNHTIRDDDNRSSYVARLSINPDDLTEMEQGAYLPGMAFTTHIRLNEKTIFRWLLDPLLTLLADV